MSRLNHGRLVVSLGSLLWLAPGCGRIVHELLELHEPVTAQVTVRGVDPGRVRAGLFDVEAAQQIAGVSEEHGRGLDLVVEDDGSIGTVAEPELDHAIALVPLRLADGATGEVVFTLPALDESTSLVAAVWIDEDGDGKLTLRADGTRERAYSPAIEVDGTTYYLSTYGYDEDQGYLGIATAPGGGDLILEDEHMDRFFVDIDG